MMARIITAAAIGIVACMALAILGRSGDWSPLALVICGVGVGFILATVITLDVIEWLDARAVDEATDWDAIERRAASRDER